jgi:S-DNA-T family DNA segregation ATPase FtsK/SpoIIIE
VITRYEVVPGPGVTISQISSRQDDLALALRAPRVRLLAPIPGKAAVGIEIPNQSPALISFRDVASRREFLEAREPLAVALGKDVMGRPFYTSLEKMPHLLVAGTTGSGKSVCLNTLIVSLLLRCTPEKLRLLLIDPKMLELTMYNDVPHLLRPVVTEPHEAARALQWLTREMEHRYRDLAALGVRNIEGYLARRRQPREGESLPVMPYIVVFVDELADLMLSNQSEIEIPIARLAQMARAVGIHLVLATQRPSVDVITGVIKANFPARIAFQVATRTDSRTVLDMNGAESLVGRGDMLFIPPGKAQAHRVHGAYLSEQEAERVAAYLREFPPPEPLARPAMSEAREEQETELDDPLFHEALRIVVGSRQGSTSLLQRRLRVGYTRAGRLMDLLERAGVVGPPDGSRAREVLVAPDYLEKVAAGSERGARGDGGA